MRRHKILVVDDDQLLRELIGQCLQDQYDILYAQNVPQAFELIKVELPHLVLLDLNLPGESGLRLFEKMRETDKFRNVQVLVLTGQIDDETRVTSFDLGADDFLEKPFNADELRIRVKARLRRVAAPPVPLTSRQVGNAKTDPDQMCVKIGEEAVKLSRVEFSLLNFFMQHPARILTREDIIKTVWQGTAVGPRTIDTHLVFLRKKLMSFDHEIHTVYGSGYMLSPRTRAPVKAS